MLCEIFLRRLRRRERSFSRLRQSMERGDVARQLSSVKVMALHVLNHLLSIRQAALELRKARGKLVAHSSGLLGFLGRCFAAPHSPHIPDDHVFGIVPSICVPLEGSLKIVLMERAV